MHLIQFREIMRDAEVAHALHPIVLKYHLDCGGDDQSLTGMRRFAGCECSSDHHRQIPQH